MVDQRLLVQVAALASSSVLPVWLALMPADAKSIVSAYVLGSAESDAGDSLDVLQAELRNGLASLLFVARVHCDRGSGGDGGLAALLSVRVGRVFGILDLGDLLLGLVREFLNAWVSHGCGVWWTRRGRRWVELELVFSGSGVGALVGKG